MMCARADGVALDGRDRVSRAIGRQLLRPQHSCPSQDGIQGRPELVRHRGEKLILEMVGLLGVLGHRLCANRTDDQALVGFAHLGHELFQL